MDTPETTDEEVKRDWEQELFARRVAKMVVNRLMICLLAGIVGTMLAKKFLS